MKKKVILLFLILLVLPLTFAAQYTCPNPEDLQFDTEEIYEGKKDTLKGLPIGVCAAIENSFSGWIESQVFVDVNLVTIEGNSTPGIELVSGNATLSFTEATSENAKIKVGGSSETLDIGDCETLGNTEVMLTSISGTGSTATVKVLVGDSKITLNTQSNPSQIVDFDSKKYAIEIFSGSNTESTIKVYTCSEGDISELSGSTPTTTNTTANVTSNQTTNTTTNQTNSSQVNGTIPPTPTTQTGCTPIGLISTQGYCTTEGVFTPQKNLTESCTENYECSSLYCHPKKEICVKRGFFRTLWSWIKGLFG